MIAAVIVAGTIAVVLAGVVVGLLRMQASERREWSGERRTLVDRAIAQHTGEIVALDRSAGPQRAARAQDPDRPTAVGL
jgi:FlaG/FlaF family flagellin (archaellin)